MIMKFHKPKHDIDPAASQILEAGGATLSFMEKIHSDSAFLKSFGDMVGEAIAKAEAGDIEESKRHHAEYSCGDSTEIGDELHAVRGSAYEQTLQVLEQVAAGSLTADELASRLRETIGETVSRAHNQGRSEWPATLENPVVLGATYPEGTIVAVDRVRAAGLDLNTFMNEGEQ